MAIRLIALDLDGTLLGAKGKVSSETIKILEPLSLEQTFGRTAESEIQIQYHP